VIPPPEILLDEKQNLFFYHGFPVRLPPTTFKLMALLAKRPGQVVTRDEIYVHLWPEYASADGSDHPYDRQISDHKRKITTQIKKAFKGKDGADPGKAAELIKTWRKVGYLLLAPREQVWFLA